VLFDTLLEATPVAERKLVNFLPGCFLDVVENAVGTHVKVAGSGIQVRFLAQNDAASAYPMAGAFGLHDNSIFLDLGHVTLDAFVPSLDDFDAVANRVDEGNAHYL